jgi:subtilisin family serine protease
MLGRRLSVVGASTALVLSALLAPAVASSPSAPAASKFSPTSPVAAPHALDEVIVGFAPGAASSARAAARASVGAVSSDELSALTPDSEVMRLGAGVGVAEAIQRLLRNPNVLYAEPNWLVTTYVANDPLYVNGSLWGMYGDKSSPKNQFGSQAAEGWAAGRTGASTVYVGVIDEGIDFSHPDLAANMWLNPFDPVDGIDNDKNGYVDDVRGWDFHRNDNTVYDGGDGDKHGTHVAGTIGASGNNKVGVAGVAWNVTMISAKFLGPSGGSISNAVKAVDYFTDLKKRHGLNIVATNNSWGGGGYSQALHDAIIRAAKAEILFIAAAGNNSSNNDTTVRYPSNYDSSRGTSTQSAAAYDNVISVAAITSTGALASFSNFGATTVDIGAPGAAINSTLPKNTYGSYSGTSMAAPHVTGGAVVVSAATCAVGASLRSRLLGTTVASTSSLVGKTVTNSRLDLTSVGANGCGSGDTVAPHDVALSASSVSVTTGDAVTLTATAKDNVGVTAVDFYVGSDLLGSVTSTPYSWSWSTQTAGSFSFTAVARDAAGNSTRSAPVTVSVSGTSTEIVYVEGEIGLRLVGGKNNSNNLEITITTTSSPGAALVSGAQVRGTLYNETSSAEWSYSGTTGSTGQVRFTLKNAPTGIYWFDITSIVASGMEFVDLDDSKTKIEKK